MDHPGLNKNWDTLRSWEGKFGQHLTRLIMYKTNVHINLQYIEIMYSVKILLHIQYNLQNYKKFSGKMY
jgi:hypothetical protein